MTPAFTISIGNNDLTELYQSRIISLEITDNSTEQADQLTLEISDHDRKIAIPDEGAVITVGLGYKQILSPYGGFILSNI